MVNVKQQIRSAAERRGIVKYGAVISACVMIVFAVVMFSLALFAPYKYYSNRDVLHILHIDDDKYENQADVYVAQNIAVHQTMFRVFSAAEALGDASVLHAFYTDGVMPDDPDRLMRAREHLDTLRKQYAEIYSSTAKTAKDSGIEIGSEQFATMLAEDLAHMNIMALDLLETAVTADKPTSYDAMFSACMLGMFGGIFNILIAALSVVTIIFSILDLITKRRASEVPVLLRLYSIFGSVCLLLLLFNTSMPPASGPLALCCAAVTVFFLYGLVKSIMSDGSGLALVRNAVVATLSGVGMLVLAATPSFIMYLNGSGGRYLYYPGTVGTVYSSWMEAMSTVGFEIPHSAITVARVLGIAVCIAAAVCADKALIRLYRNAPSTSVLSSVAMFVTSAIAVALCVSAAVITSKYQSAGTLVKYMAGASWYVCAAFMLIGGLFGLIFKAERGMRSEATDDRDSAADTTVAQQQSDSADVEVLPNEN